MPEVKSHDYHDDKKDNRGVVELVGLVVFEHMVTYGNVR